MLRRATRGSHEEAVIRAPDTEFSVRCYLRDLLKAIAEGEKDRAR